MQIAGRRDGKPKLLTARRHASHFDLARQLGKLLHELLGWPGPMTGRQFLAWQEWLHHEQHRRPTLDQLCVLRVAQRIDQKFLDKPDLVTLNHEMVGPDDLGRKTAVSEVNKEVEDKAMIERESDMMRASFGAWLGVKIPRDATGPIQLPSRKRRK